MEPLLESFRRTDSHAVSAHGTGVGHCPSLLRPAAERIDLIEGEFPDCHSNRLQLSLGGRAVVVSLFQTARAGRTATGIGRDGAGESLRDVPGSAIRCAGA